MEQIFFLIEIRQRMEKIERRIEGFKKKRKRMVELMRVIEKLQHFLDVFEFAQLVETEPSCGEDFIWRIGRTDDTKLLAFVFDRRTF